MNGLLKEVSYIAGAIIGLAILAVLVSQRSNTVNLVKAGGGVFNQALGIAISPISGGYSGTPNGGATFGSGFGLNSN